MEALYQKLKSAAHALDYRQQPPPPFKFLESTFINVSLTAKRSILSHLFSPLPYPSRFRPCVRAGCKVESKDKNQQISPTQTIKGDEMNSRNQQKTLAIILFMEENVSSINKKNPDVGFYCRCFTGRFYQGEIGVFVVQTSSVYNPQPGFSSSVSSYLTSIDGQCFTLEYRKFVLFNCLLKSTTFQRGGNGAGKHSALKYGDKRRANRRSDVRTVDARRTITAQEHRNCTAVEFICNSTDKRQNRSSADTAIYT